MQTTCPRCSQAIAIDDSKVPAGPFLVRCPRCQETMKMPGRTSAPPTPEAQAGPPPAPKAPPTAMTAAPPTPRPAPADETPVPPPQTPFPGDAMDGSNGQRSLLRAIVALPDDGHARAIMEALQRQGYAVDSVEPWEERVIELQQGVYNLVVTHRNGLPSTPKDGLFPLVSGLAPELRSRVFLVLVGEEYKTGNPTEAFAAMADFVCHPRDIPAADSLLRSTVAEKARLYRAYLDVHRKKESGEL